MSDSSARDVVQELRRIGLDPEDVPSLTLPAGATLADFIARLRCVPDGAGIEAFNAVIHSLSCAEQPIWAAWPDPGERFSLEDYTRAFALINAAPEEIAESYRAPPRHVTTQVLALLSLVSPALEARVNDFRAEVRRARVTTWISPEVLETAEVHWNKIRNAMASAVSRHE